jgi:hypothetical protein
MSIRRFLLPSLTLAFLACATLSADAQTGPIGSAKTPAKGPAVKQGPAATQGFSPDRVVGLLKAKGAQTKVTSNETKNGKFTVVQVGVKTDDFMYDFDVVFANFANGVKVWYLSTPLNTNASSLSAAQLQGLLKENFAMSGDNIFMIDSQNTLLLESSRYNLNTTDQVFMATVETYMKDVKETSTVWYSGQ